MKKILISVAPWQTRVAITRDDALQNIYFWSNSTQSLERSFFKGIITKILPGIQTAFVNIGQEKAGFLHISEIDRELAIDRMTSSGQIETEDEESSKERVRHHVDIGKILREGEPILIQVAKEPVYEKGAKLTTCFTLPGRFLVLMPNIPKVGISKKIEDVQERQRLKTLLKENLPQGMGAIIRTTSEYKDNSVILKDLAYLVDTWEAINIKFREAKPEEKIHEDLDISLQAVRDHLDEDVEAVITDDKDTHSLIYKFVKSVAPEFIYKVKLYEGPPSLFQKFNIENQIEQALEKKVNLKSGGSIIIETTEAMTVVDVNTGKYIGQGNPEETILRTNIEAAEEIVRQLRLRNIGGLIVIDFIDMASGGSRQKLFKFLEKTLKERDKFQSVVLKISEFGLVQMTRKRSGKTLAGQLTNECPHCSGSGFIKSVPTESYKILNKLRDELESKKVSGNIQLTLEPDIFEYVTNVAYNSVLHLEKTYKCQITLEMLE